MLVSSCFIMRQDFLPLFFRWDPRDPVSETGSHDDRHDYRVKYRGCVGSLTWHKLWPRNMCIHSFNACLCVCACVLSRFSHVRLFATSWTVALQAPLSVGLSRQEYWSGLPSPPPGDLPDPGIEPVYLMSPASAGRFFTTSAAWEALNACFLSINSCVHFGGL